MDETEKEEENERVEKTEVRREEGRKGKEKEGR